MALIQKKRTKAEGWECGGNVVGEISRKVVEKVAGVVATGNHKKRAEAIDAGRHWRRFQ